MEPEDFVDDSDFYLPDPEEEEGETRWWGLFADRAFSWLCRFIYLRSKRW